jgi:glucose-1-phosphate cytidylyltransferase
MKAIILAGGMGTRLSEETDVRPKPMVEIGGRPILWHVLKCYSAHGINDFVICAGYKGYVIKEYFANYCLHTSDVTFDMRDNTMEVHQRRSEPWRVTIVDTGESTQTGGRLRRVAHYLNNETFCMTYGDGVADVDTVAECGAVAEREGDPVAEGQGVTERERLPDPLAVTERAVEGVSGFEGEPRGVEEWDREPAPEAH